MDDKITAVVTSQQRNSPLAPIGVGVLLQIAFVGAHAQAGKPSHIARKLRGVTVVLAVLPMLFLGRAVGDRWTRHRPGESAGRVDAMAGAARAAQETRLESSRDTVSTAMLTSVSRLGRVSEAVCEPLMELHRNKQEFISTPGADAPGPVPGRTIASATTLEYEESGGIRVFNRAHARGRITPESHPTRSAGSSCDPGRESQRGLSPRTMGWQRNNHHA
jgi:hypothetical protein